MAERREILEMWRNRRDDAAILATLVHIEGSSYRRPGARMYIQAAGHAGSISGGCLESEVARKAAWIARAGAAVQRYSTLYDESAPEEVREVPYGLGCGGVLHLLLESVALPEAQAMLQALQEAQGGSAFVSATLLPHSATANPNIARVILRQPSPEDDQTESGRFFVSENTSAATRSALLSLAAAATYPETLSVTLDGELRSVYVEPVLPPQRLVVFGAGHDAKPLVEMAHLLGWRVAMADGRAWMAQPARFPQAEQVLALTGEADNLAALRLTQDDAVAILTHSFDQDRVLLRRLLPIDLRYLGLLGARHRSQLLLKEAAPELGWTYEECLRRVHAPIGLDLGGDSPQAVALTIVAEIQAVLHRKSVASRSVSISDWSQLPSQPYVPGQCALDLPPAESDFHVPPPLNAEPSVR
jgi:xanthine/CO dehydrogenase XdhC/CoxF family maturation factor